MSAQIQEKVEVKVTTPKMYNVIFHNDDKTPMDFVTLVLMEIFHKTIIDAQTIMLAVHNDGSAVAGTYDFETAEMKSETSNQLSASAGYPLQVTYEAED